MKTRSYLCQILYRCTFDNFMSLNWYHIRFSMLVNSNRNSTFCLQYVSVSLRFGTCILVFGGHWNRQWIVNCRCTTPPPSRLSPHFSTKQGSPLLRESAAEAQFNTNETQTPPVSWIKNVTYTNSVCYPAECNEQMNATHLNTEHDYGMCFSGLLWAQPLRTCSACSGHSFNLRFLLLP
jgi:hypothetical protein